MPVALTNPSLLRRYMRVSPDEVVCSERVPSENKFVDVVDQLAAQRFLSQPSPLAMALVDARIPQAPGSRRVRRVYLPWFH